MISMEWGVYAWRRWEREKIKGRGIVFETNTTSSTTIYGDGNENRVISRINEHNEERGEPQEIGVVNEETRCRAVIRVNRPLRLPIRGYECNGPLTTLIVHHPLNLPLSKIQAFIRKDRWWIIYEINGEKWKSNPFSFPLREIKLNSTKSRSVNSTYIERPKFLVQFFLLLYLSVFYLLNILIPPSSACASLHIKRFRY